MVAVQVAVVERMVAVQVAVVGQSSFAHPALFRSAGKKRHFLDIDNCNQCKSSLCLPRFNCENQQLETGFASG